MNISGKIPWLEEASKGKRHLIGVSGGLDSMALLHLLKEEGFTNLVVCHLDHGLRGKESTGDARFVEMVAGGMGFGMELGKVDVRELMAESGESLETAARRARHDFFGECGKRNRCGRLLLAHHADDQAETVLWNLMRGSHGCRGMRVVSRMKMGGRQMEVMRPLIGMRKAELREWMASRKFKWREDASNGECDVVRNRIRNEVLPLLDEIAGRDVAPMLARAAQVDEGFREMASWAVGKADAVDPQGRLHLGAFRSLPAALQAEVMAAFLANRAISGISAELIGRCVKLADPAGPPCLNLVGGKRLRRRAGRIFVDPG